MIAKAFDRAQASVLHEAHRSSVPRAKGDDGRLSTRKPLENFRVRARHQMRLRQALRKTNNVVRGKIEKNEHKRELQDGTLVSSTG